MLSDNPELLETGTILVTMDGTYRSNGIITNFNDGMNIEVLTDFGNIVYFDYHHELFSVYNICEKWIECKRISHPLPSVVERIDAQIKLLEAAKKYLLKGE